MTDAADRGILDRKIEATETSKPSIQTNPCYYAFELSQSF